MEINMKYWEKDGKDYEGIDYVARKLVKIIPVNFDFKVYLERGKEQKVEFETKIANYVLISSDWHKFAEGLKTLFQYTKVI